MSLVDCCSTRSGVYAGPVLTQRHVQYAVHPHLARDQAKRLFTHLPLLWAGSRPPVSPSACPTFLGATQYLYPARSLQEAALPLRFANHMFM